MSETEQQYQAVGNFLEATAKARKIRTYQEVVSNFSWLPELDGKWTSHPLAHIFDQLDQEDAHMKRPLRTSVVVSHKEGKPGPGFFKSLRLNKRLPVGDDPSKDKAWIEELKKAYEYPWD